MTGSAFHFQKIYDEFHPRILRYLSRMVGEDEAEDLTQEVFVKIDRAWDSFRGESRMSTWIYRIATNIALDRLRSHHSRGNDGQSLSAAAIEENEEVRDLWSGEEKASTDQQIIRREMNGCIREIIDTLPGDYRSVIVLGELEGLKDTEIAEVLGISLQAAKMRLHRGRALLQKELSSACIFYRDERNEFACDRKGEEGPFVQIEARRRSHARWSCRLGFLSWQKAAGDERWPPFRPAVLLRNRQSRRCCAHSPGGSPCTPGQGGLPPPWGSSGKRERARRS
jgi:RNA polymerase sigma-70 factor, ECF subfamily